MEFWEILAKTFSPPTGEIDDTVASRIAEYFEVPAEHIKHEAEFGTSGNTFLSICAFTGCVDHGDHIFKAKHILAGGASEVKCVATLCAKHHNECLEHLGNL